MDEVENFFGQFTNPWTLRVSGMGCFTSKCEKSQNHCTLIYSECMGEKLEAFLLIGSDSPRTTFLQSTYTVKKG